MSALCAKADVDGLRRGPAANDPKRPFEPTPQQLMARAMTMLIGARAYLDILTLNR
jgi:hypothetical protein